MGKTAVAPKKAARKVAKKPTRLEYVLRLNLSTKRSWGSAMTAKNARTVVARIAIGEPKILKAIGLTKAQWESYTKQNKKLDQLRSDRLNLVDQLVERSIEVYGDKGKAARWMKRPNPYLDNKAPEEMLGNIEDLAKAMAELDRIEAGVFA